MTNYCFIIYKKIDGTYDVKKTLSDPNLKHVYKRKDKALKQCEKLNQAVENGLILDEFNDCVDFNMHKICGCRREGGEPLLSSWCLLHCAKYYGCHSIAMANDLEIEFEGLE